MTIKKIALICATATLAFSSFGMIITNNQKNTINTKLFLSEYPIVNNDIKWSWSTPSPFKLFLSEYPIINDIKLIFALPTEQCPYTPTKLDIPYNTNPKLVKHFHNGSSIYSETSSE